MHRVIALVRRHWVVIVMLGAIVASFLVSSHESAQQDALQRRQSIEACVRASARFALNANGWDILAARVRGRDAPGDAESADNYQAVGRGQIDLIPAPEGFEGSAALVAVNLVREEAAPPRYVLTSQAQRLQREGCERAFAEG